MRPEKKTEKILFSPEIRQRMIAEAAYYRAERRGFQGDSAIQDWLEAEREIDQLYTRSENRRSALVFLVPC